jgi:hypothetical protein
MFSRLAIPWLPPRWAASLLCLQPDLASRGEARTSAPTLTPAKESPQWQELSASLAESLIPHRPPRRNFQLGFALSPNSAVLETEKVQEEVYDLAAQVAETGCRTIEGLCAKIRCMMMFDGVAAIGEIRMDEGIAEEMTRSVLRDVLAMGGTQAT